MRRSNSVNSIINCLIVVLGVMVSAVAVAQSTSGISAVAEAKARGRLIVGVRYDFPPFGFVNEKKEVVGFDIDMVRELAAQLLGNRDAIELVEVSGPNRIPFLVTRKVDIVAAALTITPERAKTISFGEPYYVGGYTVMVRKDNTDINAMSTLGGKRVGITRGSTADPIVTNLTPAPQQVLKLEHISELYSVMQAGRVDAVVQDVALLQPFVRKNPEFKLVGGLYAEEPWGVGVRKEDKETLDWVNQALVRMRQAGKIEEWMRKWDLR